MRFKKTIFVILFSMVSVSTAYAMTPSISLSVIGTNYNATIYGDANSQVTLYSNQYNSNSFVQNLGVIGMTSSSGYLFTTLNPATYNIVSGTPVYISVNGQNSPTVTWPSYFGSINNNSLYFNQSNITLVQGQSASSQVLGGSTLYGYYISSNSNSSVITAYLSGSTISLYAYAPGSSSIVVCQSSASCATLYVTVQGMQGNSYNYNYNYTSPAYVYPTYNIVSASIFHQYNLPATVYNSWWW